ncbi:MAG: hypothetical protein Tsb0020_17290 [Haliangiales bacterium]
MTDVPVTPIASGESSWNALQQLMASRMPEKINGFVFCNALFAFTESKLLDDIRSSEDHTLDIAAAAERHGYSPQQASGLVRYLATQGMFREEREDLFRLTPMGESMLSKVAVGWLRLVRGGYGHIMLEAGKLLDGSAVYGENITRDGFYVGSGSSQFTSEIRDEVGYNVINRVGGKTIADLGCGSATFLIKYLLAHPDRHGIAIDIDDGSISSARAAVAEAGLESRLKVVQCDAFDAAELAKHCGDADIFFSFAMEHEILRGGEQAVIDHMDSMSEHFPGKRFVVGEAVNPIDQRTGTLYWFHIISAQGMPRDVDGWKRILSGLKRAKLNEVFVPDYGPQAAYYDIAL